MDPFYLLRSMLFRKAKGLEIVVMGAGRGGTSLLTTLLDAHPQLEVASEDHVAEYLVEKNPRYPDVGSKLSAFVKACTKDAKRSKLRYGNKITTEQLGFLEDFKENLEVRDLIRRELWEGRKLVFIVRDGRTCISSKLERTGVDYDTALGYWKHSVSLLRYLKSQDLDLHLLKFEDLLQNPRKELEQLCAFLGLSYSESMLSGTSSDRILVDYRQQDLDANRVQRTVDSRIKLADIQEELDFLAY
ncbi:sulfotransferase family protein [Croceimicrobium sp.]|uniref:sulfotransferase family protein n=1 Tax=Croceimicrobium sp. TaxID=2828340 RepID=UPI003BA9FC57